MLQGNSPFHRIQLFFPQLELPIEVVDRGLGIFHFALQGQSKQILLPSQLLTDIIEHLGELMQDLRRDMTIGCRDLGLGDHPIGADQA